MYQKGKNLKFYINQAVCYGNIGKEEESLCVYINGTVSRLKARNASAIEPGCEIIVPSKVKRSIWRWLKFWVLVVQLLQLQQW